LHKTHFLNAIFEQIKAMKNALFISALLTVLVSSCFSSGIKKKLDIAESLLQPRPDSSLAIMESIDGNDLRTREEKARYALLMSAALDKNYVEVTSDSLIRIAVDYYSNRKDQQRRMMAYYYLGLVLDSAEDYTAAILSLEKAEKDAIVIDDHLYAGLISRTKGDIFNKTNNFLSSSSCLQEAVYQFRYLDNPAYALYAELGLVVSHINNQNYEKAEQILEQVEQEDVPQAIQSLCMLQRANIIVESKGAPEDAINLYKRIPASYMSSLSFGRYALAFESIGQRDSADCRFADAYSLCRDQADSATIDFLHAKAQHLRGNDQYAYLTTRKAAFVQDSLTRVLLQQSVSNAQRDYYKAESQLQEERAERLRERNRLSIAAALLALALLSGLTISYRKRKEQEIKEQMLELSIARSDLHQAEKTNASLLGSLFSEKLNHLDKISGNYIHADSDKERIIALKEFKEEIASMRTDEDLFLSLEKDLDRYCDGVMTKLRSQVPSIKGENLKLITLFFAGLPYSTVQLVMNRVSIESLKMARSRFRKEIKAANAPDDALFLNLLEMKGSRSVHQEK
jgi:predicted negative regulator of RcsB-dependent stress response